MAASQEYPEADENTLRLWQTWLVDQLDDLANLQAADTYPLDDCLNAIMDVLEDMTHDLPDSLPHNHTCENL